MGTYFIAKVISGFGDVIITLICLQAIMSWFVSALPPGGMRFYNLLASLTGAVYTSVPETHGPVRLFDGNRFFTSHRHYRDSDGLQADSSGHSECLTRKNRLNEKKSNDRDAPAKARPFVYQNLTGASFV